MGMSVLSDKLESAREAANAAAEQAKERARDSLDGLQQQSMAVASTVASLDAAKRDAMNWGRFRAPCGTVSSVLGTAHETSGSRLGQAAQPSDCQTPSPAARPADWSRCVAGS